MLIRSQNKEVLAVLESMFDVEASGGMICARKHNGWVCLLGKYSTQSKALQVLDMVQESYEEYEHKKVFKTGLSTFKTFQMPEDREVQARASFGLYFYMYGAEKVVR